MNGGDSNKGIRMTQPKVVAGSQVFVEDASLALYILILPP